ncbi:MAG: hypothetical protein WDM76_03460 [Limisphaerales bacterium]
MFKPRRRDIGDGFFVIAFQSVEIAEVHRRRFVAVGRERGAGVGGAPRDAVVRQIVLIKVK